MADPKKKMDVMSFEGKAYDFTTTEKTRVDTDSGAVSEKTTYDVKVADEDGHSVNLRQLSPWDIRPGESIRIKIERAQARLDDVVGDEDE